MSQHRNDTTWSAESREIRARRCQWMIDNGHAASTVEAAQRLAGPAGVYFETLADRYAEKG